MTLNQYHIGVRGAGIVGIWQAYWLARAGARVTVHEKSKEPFQNAASWIAGAMLAPYCETESAEPIIRELGLEAMQIWRKTFPAIIWNGTLVLAQRRDLPDLHRFQRLTVGHEEVDHSQIDALEPDLAGRFGRGLYFAEEAHLQPHWALTTLLQKIMEAGGEVRFNESDPPAGCDYIIDCRGMAAREDLPGLRGVRGEMAIIRSRELNIGRPIRLLHPRFPIYIVPWPDHYYMVGATVLESDDNGRVTVRSGLELLGSAYAVHPAFGEAEIIKLAADRRPAFADNIPKIIVRGNTLHVNGIYRHGYLISPALARRVADYLDTGAIDEEVFIIEN